MYKNVALGMDQHHTNVVREEAKAIVSKTYKYELMHQFLKKIPLPLSNSSCSPLLTNDIDVYQTYLTRGDIYFYHYGCDGYNDHGWGCAYRTCQSMISWLLRKLNFHSQLDVPSLKEIQETLVRIGDKPKRFIGSRDWIGALEVFYVIDALYNIPCKILHVTRTEELSNYVETLLKYFIDYGGFLMMGGDMDAASKGIAGIHTNGKDTYFLVMDPHYSGVPASVHDLVDKGFLRWQHTKEFVDSSFYNICLPYFK